jgi:arylformamidase
MEIIDVSMKIREDMITYPGNPSPEIQKYREIPEDSTTESRIKLGSHTGTHVDAPSHVKQNGENIDELSLYGFYGESTVLDLTKEENKISRKNLENREIDSEIILLKTKNSETSYQEFREDYIYLSLEAVEYLIDKGVKTVGIDYLSLVAFEDKPEAEKAHLKANENMNVIEGLNLKNADPGQYIFSGMPLNIEADASPIRAVLIQE